MGAGNKKSPAIHYRGFNHSSNQLKVLISYLLTTYLYAPKALKVIGFSEFFKKNFEGLKCIYIAFLILLFEFD